MILSHIGTTIPLNPQPYDGSSSEKWRSNVRRDDPELGWLEEQSRGWSGVLGDGQEGVVDDDAELVHHGDVVARRTRMVQAVGS